MGFPGSSIDGELPGEQRVVGLYSAQESSFSWVALGIRKRYEGKRYIGFTGGT